MDGNFSAEHMKPRSGGSDISLSAEWPLWLILFHSMLIWRVAKKFLRYCDTFFLMTMAKNTAGQYM